MVDKVQAPAGGRSLCKTVFLKTFNTYFIERAYKRRDAPHIHQYNKEHIVQDWFLFSSEVWSQLQTLHRRRFNA